MSLKFYNTYSHKKEIFKPLDPKKVTMYNCGPTVYNYVHIGNLSTYLMADLIRRYLEYKGYQVKQVMNITDVGHLTSDADTGEDKMIAGAKREKKTPLEIAEFYTKDFFESIKKLNIKRAEKYPKATEHIPEIIQLIENLLKKKKAYEINGNVYFDVTKFKNYGKLSGNTLAKMYQLKIGVRKEIIQDKQKKNPFDFALWISAQKKHLMKWQSPWGIGYPGWHIECSAMSTKYLGKTIDLHTGGEDNIFPHHENEIAQSESATNKKFVQYWLHKRLLLVEGKKMAKSLGNFYTLKDLEKLGFSPLDFRFFILKTHYRNTVNFSIKSLKTTQESLKRINEFLSRLKSLKNNKTALNQGIKNLISKTKEEFEKNMDNDLDTPKALASLFEFINLANKYIDKNKINTEEGNLIYQFLINIDQVLGLNLDKERKVSKENKNKIEKLIFDRNIAREEKDWQKADKIREKLIKMRVEIKDTDKVTIWKLI